MVLRYLMVFMVSDCISNMPKGSWPSLTRRRAAVLAFMGGIVLPRSSKYLSSFLFQATTIAPSPLSGGFVERVQSFRPLCEFFSIFAKYLHDHSPWISHHISHIRSCSAEINLMYALYAGFDDVDEKLLRQLPIDMSHKMSLFFK